MPLVWGLNSPQGVSALLHPEGPYDDPKGGGLREAVYARLRRHFGFVNELQLFAEVHHFAKYSVNIYGPAQTAPRFDQLANLFAPATVDTCYLHDGTGMVGGYKNEVGKWNTTGHRDRIVRVDEDALATFAQLYDEPGTPARRARLPALHAGALSSVLVKLAAYPRRLADLGEGYFSTVMFDETYSQRDGTLSRRPSTDPGFADKPHDWVLTGPHFFLANALSKTPRKICVERSQYDTIDLPTLPDDYLPRTNYLPMPDRAEYLRRTPRVCWLDWETLEVPWEGLLDHEHPAQPTDEDAELYRVNRPRQRVVTEFFRYTHRRRIAVSNERTLISALIPPGAAHVHTVLSLTLRDPSHLVSLLGITHSVIADSFVKSTGQSDLYDSTLGRLPFVQSTAISARALALN